MPQYLLGIYQPDGGVPDAETLADIVARLNAVTDEMKSAGSWVFSGGLRPPADATVIRASGGRVLHTDGPFAEGKEHLGGFTIVTAPDRAAAAEWARRISEITTLPVEIRQFQ
ncbi:YciI family protein [Amycolatopsis benzoatilytica]|uniref:YciI family protein n=1 Tax=Amycolatopsis benzoatilytica TaxID=346045 RepID=UPI0003734F71|nr:YciI family protein [Amycolatopsis benzoatilytica]